MNERQKHFADEYIISKNATKSAIKAGYSEKTSYSIGQKLLKKLKFLNTSRNVRKNYLMNVQ